MAQVNYLDNGLVFIKKVSGTSVASISVDNCFSNDYTQYKIIVDLVTTNSTTGELRLRANGIDNTSNNYNTQIINAESGTVSGARNSSLDYWNSVIICDTNVCHVTEILNPFQSTYTTICSYRGFDTDSSITFSARAGGTTVTTSYDGFTFKCGIGTATGTIYVYGYKES